MQDSHRLLLMLNFLRKKKKKRLSCLESDKVNRINSPYAKKCINTVLTNAEIRRESGFSRTYDRNSLNV